VVCIATFRRPVLLQRTLDSLARQREAPPFAVIVVDNDKDARAGLPVAAAALSDGTLTGVALLEPRQGNVEAINTAFTTARRMYPDAPYVAMIDDDEEADPHWLARLVAAAHDADIVGGPVLPVFADHGQRALARHPAFTPAYSRSGMVRQIYGTGNCLIRGAWLDRMGAPYLDPRFTFLGGGDTDFFTRSRRAGARFAWCQEAVIHETVPADRTRLGWLVRRALRNGAIGLHIERKAARDATARALVHGRTLARLAVAPAYGLWLGIKTRSLRAALHPVLVSYGRVAAMAGAEPEQYRA
jgi:glycosyltransferase involved in cell wall biosynthesis